MGLRELLIPQDKIFFEMFERQAATVREAAYLLVALSEDFTNVRDKRHAIELLEHQGDQITHGIYEQLNRTFITPLDPERSPGLHRHLTMYWTISTDRQRRCSITASRTPIPTWWNSQS